MTGTGEGDPSLITRPLELSLPEEMQLGLPGTKDRIPYGWTDIGAAAMIDLAIAALDAHGKPWRAARCLRRLSRGISEATSAGLAARGIVRPHGGIAEKGAGPPAGTTPPMHETQLRPSWTHSSP